MDAAGQVTDMLKGNGLMNHGTVLGSAEDGASNKELKSLFEKLGYSL